MFLDKSVCRRSRFCLGLDTAAVAAFVFAGSSSLCAQEHSADTSNRNYLLIHAIKSSSLDREIAEAGAKGYGFQFAAQDPTGFNILLKRDDLGPRTYRFVAALREGTFVKEVNEAGSQGFKLEFAKYSGVWALGALVQQRDGSKHTYLRTAGTDRAKALTECRQRGCSLVAVLSESLILEEKPSAEASEGLDERDYRVLATVKVSTLENELIAAGKEGFGVIAAGRMMVVMERQRGLAPSHVDYRVVAARGSRSAERKLQAAGAEGFRIAVVLDPADEGVFVLQRAPGTPERFDIRLAKLEEENVNALLMQTQAHGYHMVGFISGIAVLERAEVPVR